MKIFIFSTYMDTERTGILSHLSYFQARSFRQNFINYFSNIVLYLNSSQFKKWRQKLTPDFTNNTVTVMLSKKNINIEKRYKTTRFWYWYSIYDIKSRHKTTIPSPYCLYLYKLNATGIVFRSIPLNSYPPKHDHCKWTTYCPQALDLC